MLYFKRIKEIESFITDHEMIKENDKVLIAFSGGPDSVFLFHALNSIKERYNLEISVIYINHNLRDDVRNDIKFIDNFTKQNNIQSYIESVDVKSYAKQNKLSIETAARELRYSKISEIKEKYGYTKIATGHNLDDNVETFIFRLLRGTSMKGLKGIPATRENIVRPILMLEKSYILEELNQNKLEFLIDYTNDENIYSRNIIRNEIFPHFERINPKFRNKIINIIDEISVKEERIDIYGDRLLIESILKENDSNQNRIIASYLENNNIEINKEKIKLIKKLMGSKGSKSINLSSEKVLFKEYNAFVIRNIDEQDKEQLEFDVQILNPESVSADSFNRSENMYLIPSEIFGEDNEILVRTRQEGDKIEFKLHAHKSLKKLFIDKKVVKWEREKIPVVEIVYKNMYNITNKEILVVGELAHSPRINKIKSFDEYNKSDKILIIGRNNGR